MARYGRLLTDAQWEKIRPLLPKRRPRPRGGRPPANDRKVLEGPALRDGFCAAAPAGKICRRNFPRLRPAGEGGGIGKSKMFG